MLVLASLTDGFDKSTGQLQPHDQVAIPEDAAGPRHMVFHPNGNFAFVLNELQNTVTCCSYSPAEGRLSVLGDSISAIIIPTTASGGQASCTTRPPNRGGAAEIEISPDGSHVWATVPCVCVCVCLSLSVFVPLSMTDMTDMLPRDMRCKQ